MIHVDTPHPNAEKKLRSKQIQVQSTSAVPTKTGAMTIPISARKPNHPNKWDKITAKMAETKHRKIDLKDVKSKVFITNTKVNLIPSHPPTAHRVQEKEQKDPLIKTVTLGGKGGKLVPKTKSDRDRVPKLIVKESYSSQSSTLSSSSEDQHSHHHRDRRLVKQSSSTSCTSTGTVINPSSRSPSAPSSAKSTLRRNKQPELNNAKSVRGVPSPQEIQTLRAELSLEREARDRILQENKKIKHELKAVLESKESISRERQTLELQFSSAERRLKEARSDWDREREHAQEESEAQRVTHGQQLQKLAETHGTHLDFLKEAHQTEVEVLKSVNQSDLNQLRTAFELRENEREQKYEFEMDELKAKHSEELENLESHYKVEIELHQHKLKKSYPTYTLSPGSKENVTDLLNKEITSLTVVVELRNNEIKDLRQEVMSQRLELERLQSVDDQNHQLIQKVEDLQAQVQKTRNDRKKLIVENQTMQSSIHEAVTAKEKLSMELDFLRYRIETSETDGTEPLK